MSIKCTRNVLGIMMRFKATMNDDRDIYHVWKRQSVCYIEPGQIFVWASQIGNIDQPIQTFLQTQPE